MRKGCCETEITRKVARGCDIGLILGVNHLRHARYICLGYIMFERGATSIPMCSRFLRALNQLEALVHVSQVRC